jgi:hypothetical protein
LRIRFIASRFVVGLMFARGGFYGNLARSLRKRSASDLMVLGGWVEIICGFLVAFGR